MQKRIKFDHIILDAGTQVRMELDKGVIEEYAELYKAKTIFPPLDVFQINGGGKVILVDGFHRYHAAHRPKMPADIVCEIHKGTLQDAIKFALSANCKHGLRRTNADKRRAVIIAFEKLDGLTLSDVLVTKMCGVGRTLVAEIRKAMPPLQPVDSTGSNAEKPAKSPKRKGADGKLRSVPTIPPPPPPAPGSPPKPAELSAKADGKFRDKLKFIVPPEIIPTWNDAEEMQGLLDNISDLRGVQKTAESKQNIIFAEVNHSSLKAALDQAYADLKRCIPYAVCDNCQGINFKECPSCKGRGFVSEFYWKNCVTAEKKELRKAATT